MKAAVAGDELGMEGIFRRPPLPAMGFLYGLTTDGRLIQLAVRTGAQGREIARLKTPSAGLNRGTVVDVRASGIGPSGWTMLAVSEAAVEAVSLTTHAVRTLYQADAAQPIVANASESEAGGFRGLVATSELYAFVLRTGVAECTLMVRYFSNDLPAEQPLTIAGRQVMGPALCAGHVLFCSEEEVGFYDIASSATGQARLPSRFVPLLTRSSTKLNAPSGAMPMTIVAGSGGRLAWIGGFEGGRPGVLQVNFLEGSSTFRPLPTGTSLSTNDDGTLWANADGDLEGFGISAPRGGEIPRLQPGMPVCYVAPYLFCFGETQRMGEHDLYTLSANTGRLLARLRFEDPLCTEATCCGITISGSDVVTMCLDLLGTRRGHGIRMEHWHLAE